MPGPFKNNARWEGRESERERYATAKGALRLENN